MNEKLVSVAADIEAIEELILGGLQTTDQLLALRTVQELYRRLADRSPGRHLPLRVGWVAHI